ncbi:MAG: GNAT family N-acetyltransferase [Halopenitus sp.]
MPDGAADEATLPTDQSPGPEHVRIRTATPDDRLEVARVLDGAMLETGDLPERLRTEDVLVAVAERDDGRDAERPAETVVGAAVLETRGENRHLDGVAVRRARRDRGIGSALVVRSVRDAREMAGVSRVTAEFDAELRDFYAGLGFDVEPASTEGEDEGSPDRLRGTLPL